MCCYGVEILADLHVAAEEPSRRFAAIKAALATDDALTAIYTHGQLDAAKLASRIELQCADLFEADLSTICQHCDTVVFCCCVTWPLPLLRRLAIKLARELPFGARVVTVGQQLPEPEVVAGDARAVRFEEVERFNAHFEWGSEVVICACVAQLGILETRRLRKTQAKRAA